MDLDCIIDRKHANKIFLQVFLWNTGTTYWYARGEYKKWGECWQGCILFYSLWFFSPTPRFAFEFSSLDFLKFKLHMEALLPFSLSFSSFFMLMFHFLQFSCLPFPFSIPITPFLLLSTSLSLIFLPQSSDALKNPPPPGWGILEQYTHL